MTLRDILKITYIFDSVIWADAIETIRDHLDPHDEGSHIYTFNSVDAYILTEFADWEVVPDLIDDGELDESELRRRVDSIIGVNKDYWLRMVESLEAEFNPLYNVDANETTTSSYGIHETTNAIGQRQRTDTNAPTQETTQYGAAETETEFGSQQYTSGARSDSTTDGAQEITHKRTTMDDTATFKNESRDEHAAVSNSSTKGAQIDSTTAHTDKVTAKTHTDTVSTIQTINTAVDAAATDTVTSKAHSDTVTVRRYGNIGVTMSTQLLSDFQRFARESKLVPIIAVEISRALTFSIWY